MKLHDGPRLTVTKANVSTDETLPRRYVEPGVGVSKHVRWGRFAQASLTVQTPNSTRYYSARLYLHNRNRTTAKLIQAESKRTGWPVGQVHLVTSPDGSVEPWSFEWQVRDDARFYAQRHLDSLLGNVSLHADPDGTLHVSGSLEGATEPVWVEGVIPPGADIFGRAWTITPNSAARYQAHVRSIFDDARE